MKTIITSTGNTVDSEFDKRFGRAAWFCIFDEESKETKFIENQHFDAPNGAGIKAAETVAEFDTNKVISGDFGPKAKDLLDKLKIQMIIMQDNDLKVSDIISKLSNQ